MHKKKLKSTHNWHEKTKKITKVYKEAFGNMQLTHVEMQIQDMFSQDKGNLMVMYVKFKPILSENFFLINIATAKLEHK